MSTVLSSRDLHYGLNSNLTGQARENNFESREIDNLKDGVEKFSAIFNDRADYLSLNKPIPGHGINYSKVGIFQKRAHWRNARVLSLLPLFTTFITVAYFFFLLYVDLLPSKRPRTEILKFVICALVLSVLPLARRNTLNYLVEGGTAVVMVICIMLMEDVVGRQQCMVTYMTFLLVCRMMYYKTIFDNFSICISYSASVVALNTGAEKWYISTNVLIWVYLFVSMLLLFVFQRLWSRVWEHTRILMTLAEKQKREHSIGRALIGAHVSPDIVNHIFPVNKPTSAGKVFTTGSDKAGRRTIEAISSSEAADASTPLFEAAIAAGLLPNFTDAQMSLSQLQSMKGFDRRECAVVAIGFDSAGDAWAQGNQALHELLDKLAATHRITCVRKFGSVRLGCVGFFRTWESASVNSHEALLFACEASYLVGKFASRTTYAVDCGTITGGYLNSLNFDLFGQEVRWLLMVLELQLYGKIAVGESVQKQLHLYKKACPESFPIKVAPWSLSSLPWCVGEEIQVHLVDNLSEIVDAMALAMFVADATDSAITARGNMTRTCAQNFSLSEKELVTPPIDWRELETLLAEDDPRRDASYYLRSLSGDMWEIKDSQPCLDQEIGEEFLLSASHRYQLSLDDAIFNKMTDAEMYAHQETCEQELYALIRRVCFPGTLQFWCLFSSYTDTAGHNEYKSVMFAYDAYFFDEWYEYAGPVAALFGQSWVAKLLRFDAPIQLSAPKMSVPAGHEERPRNVAVTREEEEATAAPFTSKKKVAINKSFSPRAFSKRNRRIAVSPIDEVDEEGEDEEELDEKVGEGMSVGAVNKDPPADFTPADVTATPFVNANIVKHKHGEPKMPRYASQDECKRGWDKYAGDIRLFFFDSRANAVVTVACYLAVWFAVHPFLVAKERTMESSEYMCIMLLHVSFMLMLERRYDNYLSVVIFLLTALSINALTYNYICSRTLYNENSLTLPKFGDFGGEVPIAILAVGLLPYHMRQHMLWSFLDSGIVPIMQLVNARLSGITCTQPARYRSILLYLLLLFALYYWTLQFTAYASYILEHKLLPEAVRNYRKQKANTRALLHAFAPSVPNNKTCQLFAPKSYRQCAIAALHIKTADQLSHFVEPKDLALILNKIHLVVEKCIAECGMLSVTHFSGVYIAAACRDSAWDSVESLRFPDSHTARTVVLLRRVRTKLAALSRELKFSIQLGIGIDQGPVQLGFLGQNRFCYDIAGPARDLAVAMSSFHGSGAFANEAFDSDIRKMQAPEDLIRDVTGLLEPSRSNGSRWLRIDGSFNGIQLEDFKYLCLLGQGGYGSVHLLAEKHTGVPYAIKAIELKQESKLSKMIERECSILQMIQHPNVVNLKYSFRNHNRLYLVMSYIRGGNLKQVVERDNLDLAHMLSWFAELMLAVDYLHCMGIIHRDVKPANCMIGTDGHLKLADFGLSKVVNIVSSDPRGYSRRAVEANDNIGLSYEAFQKVRKFLPLKIDAAHREDAVEATMHRTIRVLLITMDDDKADSTLLFINTTVEINIADYDIDSDTIRSSNFEAIFIDGDYYVEDGVEFVQHFCSMLLNSIPVLLIAKNEDLRQRGLKAGARACSRLPLEALNEDTFDVLFGPEPDCLIVDPLQNHLLDVMGFQDEQIAKIGQEPAVQPSTTKKVAAGSDRTNESRSSSMWSRQPRDSVAVESRSHSLVGTLHFIAPEVIKLRKYGKAVDWWAAGMTVYECLVRKHMFSGEDKKAVFENIMNAPIDLTPLEPFGDAIVSLVKGLLCRDIKKRLGSQSMEVIKAHKAFEKIDWATVSTGNPAHRPAQFVNRKFRAEDKDLFYGPRGGHFDLHREQLDDRSTASMQKYLLNKKRARMRDMLSGHSSRSGKRSVNRPLSLSTGGSAIAGVNNNSGGSGSCSGGRRVKKSRAEGGGSKSFGKKSKDSGGSRSLELVQEGVGEDDTAVGLDLNVTQQPPA